MPLTKHEPIEQEHYRQKKQELERIKKPNETRDILYVDVVDGYLASW